MADPAPTKVTLEDKFALFSDHWAPRLAARYNGNEVRLAKVEGEFHWHKHDETDELFLVIEGELDMEFREHTERIADAERYCLPISCANLILKNEEQIDGPKWPCVTAKIKSESCACRSAA